MAEKETKFPWVRLQKFFIPFGTILVLSNNALLY